MIFFFIIKEACCDETVKNCACGATERDLLLVSPAALYHTRHADECTVHSDTAAQPLIRDPRPTVYGTPAMSGTIGGSGSGDGAGSNAAHRGRCDGAFRGIESTRKVTTIIPVCT